MLLLGIVINHLGNLPMFILINSRSIISIISNISIISIISKRTNYAQFQPVSTILQLENPEPLWTARQRLAAAVRPPATAGRRRCWHSQQSSHAPQSFQLESIVILSHTIDIFLIGIG